MRFADATRQSILAGQRKDEVDRIGARQQAPKTTEGVEDEALRKALILLGAGALRGPARGL